MSRLPDSVLRAVCYIRKSREDEEAELRGEDTLTKQRELMIRDVLNRFEFAYDLAEEVASGDSIKDRPVFRSILPQLGTVYQAIVCKDLSRLGRGSYGDMGVVYDIIRDRRIYIVTKDAVYDPSNFSDLRMIRFSLFFNREEYEMTLWRLTEGKYDGASKGKWVAGAVPFGFQYDSKSQVLVPNEAQAKTVRLIYQLYVEEGLGFRAIATHLHRLGFASPRGKDMWRGEVIHRMLKNPAYIGTLSFRKTRRNKLDGRVLRRPESDHIVVEHAFDPIIPPELWLQAQQRLNRGSVKPKVKLDFSPSELAGLIRCKRCQHKMVRQSSVQHYTKKDGTRSRYEKEFLYCTRCGYAVKYRVCETQLIRVLSELTVLDDEVLMEQLRKQTSEHDQSDVVDHGAILKQLEEKRLTLWKRLERAREFLVDGTFTRSDFEEIKLKCEKELEEVERGLAYASEIRERIAEPIPTIDLNAVRNRVKSVVDAYQALTDRARKNTLLSAIFEGIELEFVHKGRGKNDPTRFNLFIRLQSVWFRP